MPSTEGVHPWARSSARQNAWCEAGPPGARVRAARTATIGQWGGHPGGPGFESSRAHHDSQTVCDTLKTTVS